MPFMPGGMVEGLGEELVELEVPPRAVRVAVAAVGQVEMRSLRVARVELHSRMTAEMLPWRISAMS
jgi:hypothetical protein